ncbi:MAG: hypothetical protein IJZ85_06800 [Lachnospiraceae bacterium]|nr:hypothetical protein [Lachnospiraceae bacterium]
MLDLLKSFLLIFIYITIFLSLGAFILRTLREKFSFSLAILSGFFFYHLLFSLVALPCILTQQTLTMLIWIWLPILCVIFIVSIRFCFKNIVSDSIKMASALLSSFKTPSSLVLPTVAVFGILLVLYLSISAPYMGWDTAFYVRTTLHAVENDSMYTLDAASGQMTSVLSLRYALSTFYMNSAIACRLTGLHPLLVQNVTDGCICVILAFAVIYRIGLLAFHENRQKACLMIIFAVILHVSHTSVFSTSDFLLLRSYEAKAYCSNIILPFIGYMIVSLWKEPDKRANWLLLFLGTAASIPVSMSSLLTVPVLVAAGSLIWLFTRNWRALGKTCLCLIPHLLYLGAYILEHIGVLTIYIR